MEQGKFSKKGHAYKHADLTADPSIQHPDYEVELGDPETSKTARMAIFKLFPKSRVGPRFEGRWDDKQEELDVDVFDVTPEVKVMWPDIGTVIEGTANFKIHRVLPTK